MVKRVEVNVKKSEYFDTAREPEKRRGLRIAALLLLATRYSLLDSHFFLLERVKRI
jgi:hypothetical protein